MFSLSVPRSNIVGILMLISPLLGFTVPAVGDSDVVTTRITVNYRDLDLETESGAQALIRRVSKAAVHACGGRPSGAPIELYSVAKARFEICRSNAVQSTITKLNHPMVTMLFERRRTIDNKVVSR